MLTIEQAKINLQTLAQGITPQNWHAGKTWYTQAHTFCVLQSEIYHVPVKTVISILAVLSPQSQWPTNKRATVDILKYQKTIKHVYPENVKKALRCLNGELFEVVTSHNRYGNKVRAFYDNILHLDNSQLVTVDTHIIKAAFNSQSLNERQVRWVFESQIGYNTISEACKRVAKHYNMPPNQFQAALWLTVKASLKRSYDE
jgi:hypothetical protein